MDFCHNVVRVNLLFFTLKLKCTFVVMLVQEFSNVLSTAHKQFTFFTLKLERTSVIMFYESFSNASKLHFDDLFTLPYVPEYKTYPQI